MDKFAKAEGLHKYFVLGLAALVKFHTDLLEKKKIKNSAGFGLPWFCLFVVFFFNNITWNLDNAFLNFAMKSHLASTLSCCDAEGSSQHIQ